MKKFIISFEYQRLSFSAKVLVRKSENIFMFSISLLQSDFNYELNGMTMTFVKGDGGFLLMLIHEDQTFEIVPWEIKLEYLDGSGITHHDTFSLS